MKFKARSTLRRHLKNFHPEEAPQLLKEMDEVLEKERAKKREKRPELYKERRKEREKRKLEEKKEQKALKKFEKKEQKLSEKLEMRRQIQLEKIYQKEQERLARIKKREENKYVEYQDVFTIKEEPYDDYPGTIVNSHLSQESPQIEIPIKEEPEIEISEVIKETLLS
jgi:hypothetical protein